MLWQRQKINKNSLNKNQSQYLLNGFNSTLINEAKQLIYDPENADT